jgi:two-component system sensor histidine kinase DegS
MKEELNLRLQDVLSKASESLNYSIDHVVEIRDEVLSGLRELEGERESVHGEITEVIEANEQIAETYRRSRAALAKAALAGNEEVQARAYEEAERYMRLKGTFEERELSLRRRRDHLDREIRRLRRVLGRSDEMMEQLRLALQVLVHRLEDLSLSEGGDPRLAAYALQFAERETNRLAREVHDGPAQIFAGGIMMLDGLERMLGAGNVEGAVSELRKVRSQMGEGLTDFRAFLNLLRPPGLDQGFQVGLDRFAEATRARAGVQVEVRLDGNLSRLSPPLAVNMFRIIQESVGNALRHGGARRIRIMGSVGGDVGVFKVVDDGKGFDVEEERQSARERGSYGLANMEERMRLCSGNIRIDSTPGRGTSIAWTVPLGEGGA